MFSAAVKRGVYFEICYNAALIITTSTTGSGRKSWSSADSSAGRWGDLIPPSDPATARRNFIANATSLIRALRGGRNVVFSSEAATVLGLRAPMDVLNLGVLLGVSAEVAMEGIREAPAMVVRAAKARRIGWRGVVLGVQIVGVQDDEERRGVKRKVDEEDEDVAAEKMEEVKPSEKPLSKRQMKRLAQRARVEREGKGVDAVRADVVDKM